MSQANSSIESNKASLEHTESLISEHEETARINNTRYHYMDNLRALAMLLGIFFHASLAYSPLVSELWLAAETQNSIVVDFVAWFSHLFRMPLFFLIAGFFTLMLLEKRGAAGLLKNRGLRIGLPFVIFLPLSLVSVIGGIMWAITNVENQTTMLEMIKVRSETPGAEQPPFSTMHLWFLFNLLWFYLVAVLVYKLKIHQSKFVDMITSHWFALIVLPALMIPAMLTQTVPHPAAERIYPEIWSLGFNGIFFMYGFFLFKKQSFVQGLDKHKYWMLVVSLAAYCYLFSILPEKLSFEDAMRHVAEGIPLTLTHVIQVILECYIAVYMTFVCLAFGRRFLEKESVYFRYIADSSYWIYILHLPVLFFIQYLLLDIELNMWVEFLISSFGTLAIGLVTYALLVRATPLGKLLNGKRQPVFPN